MNYLEKLIKLLKENEGVDVNFVIDLNEEKEKLTKKQKRKLREKNSHWHPYYW